MSIQHSSLTDPIEQRIAWAEHCYTHFKDKLLGDPEVSSLLRSLQPAIRDSHSKMAELGIGHLCKTCEEKDGGSCCGAGLEKHLSGTLVLINLLLGIKIPTRKMDPASCFFLSTKGCQLLARHVICVNYLCAKIAARVPASEISRLRELEGVELNLLFVLHERLKRLVGTLIEMVQMQGTELSFE
jgi:hypothetical protein